MKIQFKKLSEKAVAPKKFNSKDAGFDLTATNRAIRPHYVEYDTHLAVNIPEGHVGLLFPRSSVTDKPLTLGNSVGVIDAGFQGSIKMRFRKSASATLHGTDESELYQVGERIGQLVILELPKVIMEEVEEFTSSSTRGSGAFGSTGKGSKKLTKKVKKDE